MSENRGNLIALAATRATRLVTGIGISLLLARLGPEALGIHGWAMSLASVAAFSTGFGLHLLMVRKVAREPQKAGQTLGLALTLLGLTSMGTLAVVAGWATLSDGRPTVVLVAVLAAAAMAVGLLNENIAAVFHGLRKMRLEVPGVLGGRLLYVVLATGAIFGGLGLAGVFAAQLLGALATALVLAWIARQTVGSFAPRWHADDARNLFGETFPFGMNILFGSVYLAADTLMLKEFRPDEEVGWYRLAALLGLQLPVAAQILSRSIYPKLSKMHDRLDEAADELSFALRLLLTSSLPAAVGATVLALPIVVFLGGSEAYAPAAPALMLLMPMLPLRFVNNGLGTALSALDRQHIRTRGVALAAGFNVVANFIAIPIWGYLGAAGTTLATDLLLTFFLWWNVRQALPALRMGGAVVRTLLPALAMGAVVALLPPMHVVLAVVIGAAAVLPLMRLSGAWQAGDLRRLRAI